VQEGLFHKGYAALPRRALLRSALLASLRSEGTRRFVPKKQSFGYAVGIVEQANGQEKFGGCV
jgi:hypothetical protein